LKQDNNGLLKNRDEEMKTLQQALKDKESQLLQIEQNNKNQKETESREVLQKDIDKLKSE